MAVHVDAGMFRCGPHESRVGEFSVHMDALMLMPMRKTSGCRFEKEPE
jgi:hypothetical protein